MKNFIIWIKWLLFGHDWEIEGIINDKWRRECKRCGKRQCQTPIEMSNDSILPPFTTLWHDEKFEWEFCSHCVTMMIICPKCGNNTCNGMYGRLENGEKCDVCPQAYEYAKNNEESPRPDDWKEQAKKSHLDFKRMFGRGEITDKDIEQAEKIIKQRE